MAFHKLFPHRYSAWSWHCRPTAVRHVGTKDQTLWAPITDSGVYLCAYNHATAKYSEVLVGSPGYDDHNNASILVRADGHIVVAWTGHVVGQLNFRKTTIAEDIFSLGTIVQVTAKPSYSYVQLVELSAEGKIFCFCRRNWTSSDGGSGLGITTSERVWDILISSDGGATFAHHSVPLCFEADGSVSAPYTEPYSNGVDTIWFARSDWMSGSLSMDREDVIFFKYISGPGGTPGSFYKADGTLICAWSALPIMDKSALEIVYDTSAQSGTPATFVKDIIVDTMTGDITIAFTTMDTATEVNTYRTARWNGTSWVLATVVEAGYDFTNDANQPAYEGGVVIDPNDIDALVLSREQTTGGGHWEIERWETTNAGVSWAKTQNLTAGDSSLPAKIVRPMIPRGYAAELPLFFMGGTYELFTNFQTESYAITPTAFSVYPPSAFAADPFDDHGTTYLSGTSHSLDAYGNAWIKHPSFTAVASPSITDGVATSGVTSLLVLLNLGTPSTPEYSVSTICRRISTADGRYGVVGRMLNSTGRNGYGARLYPATNTVELYRYIDNTATLLDSASFVFGVGDEVVLTLELFDDAKRVLIDGVEYCASTDNTHAASGYAGVIFSSGTGMALGDFWAFTAASGTSLTVLQALRAQIASSLTSAADLSAGIATSGAGSNDLLATVATAQTGLADLRTGVATSGDTRHGLRLAVATVLATVQDVSIEIAEMVGSIVRHDLKLEIATEVRQAQDVAFSVASEAATAQTTLAAVATAQTSTAPLTVDVSTLLQSLVDLELRIESIVTATVSQDLRLEIATELAALQDLRLTIAEAGEVLEAVFIDYCRPRSFADYCRPRGRRLQ